MRSHSSPTDAVSNRPSFNVRILNRTVVFPNRKVVFLNRTVIFPKSHGRISKSHGRIFQIARSYFRNRTINFRNTHGQFAKYQGAGLLPELAGDRTRHEKGGLLRAAPGQAAPLQDSRHHLPLRAPRASLRGDSVCLNCRCLKCVYMCVCVCSPRASMVQWCDTREGSHRWRAGG